MSRFAVLNLTEAAAERVKSLVARSPKPVAGIRVAVRSGGCSGYTYQVDYADTKGPLDEVVTEHGATVFVDPSALLVLIGSVMDYKESQMESGFVFQNPNETARCGCGESFSVDPAAAAEGAHAH